LKTLSLEDKKTVRLVCKNWNYMCTEYVKFNPVLKGAHTFYELTTTDSIFHEMTIERFALTMHERQHNSFVGGGNIQKLTFKESVVGVDNLKWLFTSCYNLEQIHIDYRRQGWRGRWGKAWDFLTQELPKAISLCQNLQRLDIFVGDDQRANKWHVYRSSAVLLDCKSLESCKNLKYLNIRSLGTFSLINCAKLPTSLRRLNVLVLLFRIEPPQFHNEIIEDLIKQFQTKDTSSKSPSKRTISIEDLIEVQKYFENCHTINFVSNNESEWELFLDVIPDIMDQLCDPGRQQPLNHLISTISNFSFTRAGKTKSTP